jgi:hypothetical protein
LCVRYAVVILEHDIAQNRDFGQDWYLRTATDAMFCGWGTEPEKEVILCRVMPAKRLVEGDFLCWRHDSLVTEHKKPVFQEALTDDRDRIGIQLSGKVDAATLCKRLMPRARFDGVECDSHRFGSEGRSCIEMPVAVCAVETESQQGWNI